VKRLLKALLPVCDLVLAPFLFPAAALLRLVRRAGVERMPLSRRVLSAVGVFPITNHYYEPLLEANQLLRPLDEPRNLPGIDMDAAGQLRLLTQFKFSEELRPFTARSQDELTYSFDNGYFDSGDAEFLYNLVRLRKPRRVIEVGSGRSTLLVTEAIRRNREAQGDHGCRHICIEPYEAPWLERSGVTVRRARVESVEPSLFQQLEAGDVLFIDSSHVIRPQGDVLFAFLEILPSLRPGVIVHIHDIFTPRDYPREWVVDKMRFWNEQYLLEALLSENPKWKVIGALNFLCHEYYDQLKDACPFLTPDRSPSSFYIEKVR
jgi:predicted O-methyltransferase YrrM